ncbi:serine/threonine-protein kinase [Archangium lansingense]|uniref:Serine/threonine-protein kinase n=1 Tax=Archangium lansingense TaxID=2995310 RepID=A0ABT3ZZG2_9BACT|nr:serine/threonine-protein kinase [Archangium lansinium]MCY1074770.1 serine/threonine-protein kinase [Archangium lansinium]
MPSLDVTSTAISRTHSPDLIPGYRLESLVGAGGMGEVHKATQLSLGRTVAVKLLSQQLAQEESFVARFQKEAAALATLRHPNIVSIVDKGSTVSTYYLVMEFVDGPSLRERMRAPQEDSQDTLRVMLQICRAIEYAHGRGVIHRDLKPENILFDEQAGDIPKVTDFGLASFLEDTSTRFALTGTHMAMGTLSYMAPEQRVDAKNADGRADIFALGLILYEMLVGELPAGSFEPPSRRKPKLDPRLDGIIANCLKQQPADRYATVSDLIRDLEPLAPHYYTTMRPAKLSRMQRVGRAVRKAVRVFMQGVAALLVLSAMGVLALAYQRTLERRVPIPPGIALTGALGPASAERFAGRLSSSDGEPRKVTLGEGPDKPSMLVSGRRLELDDKKLVFPAVEGQSRVGLMRVDLPGMKGDTARFVARVNTLRREPTFPETLRHALLQDPLPDSQVALLLLEETAQPDDPKRYVALVYGGAGVPIRLEWRLGEKRGTMLGPDSPEGPVELELAVDEEGALVALLGSKGDKRPIFEPLQLGLNWQELRFGGPPAPAFGCIEGICQAESFSYQVKPAPPKPAGVVQASAPVRAETPRPVAPTPAKRPPPKPAPAPKGKRSK